MFVCFLQFYQKHKQNLIMIQNIAIVRNKQQLLKYLEKSSKRWKDVIMQKMLNILIFFNIFIIYFS